MLWTDFTLKFSHYVYLDLGELWEGGLRTTYVFLK